MSSSPDIFDVFQFHADERRESEPMGTKTKYWFFRNDDPWLFKEGYEGTGDKWSEKVAYELSRLIELPAARVELAQLQQDGVVIDGTASKNFVSTDADLVHGNELLASTVDEYDKDRRFHQSQHRVDRILDILDQEVGKSAVDTFVGYLVFDAWIANVDRHHENWAVVQSEEVDRIAPSYDHASSLGRLLDDQKRTRILQGRDRLTVQTVLDALESRRSRLSTERNPAGAAVSVTDRRLPTRLWL